MSYVHVVCIPYNIFCMYNIVILKFTAAIVKYDMD